MKKAIVLSMGIIGATGLALLINSCKSTKDPAPEKCGHNTNLKSSEFQVYKIDDLGEPSTWLGIINVKSILQTYTFRTLRTGDPYIFDKTGEFDTTTTCAIKTLTSTDEHRFDLVRYRFEYSSDDLDGDGTNGTDNGIDIKDFDDIVYYDFSYSDPTDNNATKYVRWVKSW